jgi:hypothetical protein
MQVDGSEKYTSEVINMSFLNPFNWFKKEEPVGVAPLSTGATAPSFPGGPYESAAGRRRRHRKGGQTLKAGQKAGRRHRRKHSRRA